MNTPLSLLNYIRVRDITIPVITTSTAADALTNPTDVKQSTQYFDGLGRVIQTVSRQASPLLKDIVSVNVYDLASREIVKYLPYVSTANDGIINHILSAHNNSLSANVGVNMYS